MSDSYPPPQSSTSSSSSMVSLPLGNSRKRKLIFDSMPTLSGLSTLKPLSEIDQDFLFELRQPVSLPRGVQVRGKHKQVFNFELYDATGQNFEVAVWEPRANNVYELLSKLQTPVCVFISHAKTETPSEHRRPKTAIKHLRLIIDKEAIVAKSDYPPPSATSEPSEKRIHCECNPPCHGPCQASDGIALWDFMEIAKNLRKCDKTRRFQGLDVQIFGNPKIERKRLICNVSDGSFLARLESPIPKCKIGNGTKLHLNIFSARFYFFSKDQMTLKIMPDEKYPVELCHNTLNLIEPLRTGNGPLQMISPADAQRYRTE